MTKGKKFKKRVRARVAETGESYSRAREVEGAQKGLLTFWYYYSTEYPEEGSVFPFHSWKEAWEHAGEHKDEMTFAEREATEEETILIDFGIVRTLKTISDPLARALEERDEARKMARAIRSEAGFEETWPLPWESSTDEDSG